ncbi:MAG: PEP-CTERM sorting domain-containing protein [Candidatus Competibacteraceae bacterium]
MKLNTLHAAALVMALAASSTQAVAVPSFEGYAAIGDYIDVGSFDLSEITLSLSSTLPTSPGPDLTLYIYDDAGNPIGDSTGTGAWGGSNFNYSFVFSSPLSITGGFVYALSYAGFQNLTNPDELKVQLTDQDSTPAGNIWASTLDITVGDIYAEDAPSYFPLGFFDPATGNKINLTPVATVKNDQGQDVYSATGGVAYLSFGPTIPEPATLALLGIGLAGLGFTRRRKTAVVG